MRKSLRVLVLVLGSLVGLSSTLSAQQATQSVEQVEANTPEGVICDPPATVSDLEKATKEIKAEVRAGDQKSAAEIKALTVETAKNSWELNRLQNTTLSIAQETQKKLFDQQRLITELAQARAREEWWGWIKFFCGALGFLALVALAMWGIAIARHNSRTAEVIAVQTVVKKEEPLVDPEIPVLREYDARNGGTRLVPFTLTLSDQRVHFYCTAKLRDGQKPLVNFAGEDGFVAWEKRKSHARTLYDDKGMGIPITENVTS